MFYSSRNGWNNNPTALQFAHTFRRLLLHSKISGRGGNCKVLDIWKKRNVIWHILIRKYGFDLAEQECNNHDYDLIPDFIDVSEVSANVVTYISGFVLKILHRTVKCLQCLDECATALERVKENPLYKLIFRKNRGTYNGCTICFYYFVCIL